MKYLIASDLHGSYAYAQKLMDAFQFEKADKLLLLGDLLYHGPRNDLPKEYDPKKVIPLLNAQKENILAVRGNCDAEVDQMVLEFPMMADYLLLTEGKCTIFVTHGHLFNEQNVPPLKKGDVLLHGHTHLQVKNQHETYTYLNPGSLSIPKENSVHGYMTLENGVFIWKNLLTKEEIMSFQV